MAIRSLERTGEAAKVALEAEYGPKFILDRYAQGLAAARPRITDYWLNHSFLLGFQWTYVDDTDNVIRQVATDPGREQAVINRLAPNTRTLMGKLTQRNLEFEVPPSSPDDGSVQASRLAESVLRGTHRAHRWELLREKAALAAFKGGTAAISIDWDPSAGHVIVGPTDDSTEIRGGDSLEQVLSIADFVVEPGVRDAEFARWWIKVEALPPQTVQSIYNLPDTPKPDTMAGQSGIHHKLVPAAGVATATGASGDNLTLVLTYYERPNQQAPEGRISVVVNGEIVEGEGANDGADEMPWPFPWRDRLNLVVIRETIIESEWMGHTILTQTRGVQATLNAAWSSIIEHMKLAGNARLAIPESAIDLVDEFTDLPGEVVPYPDGSSPPFYLQPAQLPAWLIDTPVNLSIQIDDIMGVHDVSRGVAPANVESGFGISILAENDTTPLGRLSKEIARSWSEVSSMVLQLMEQEVGTKRRTVVEEDGLGPIEVNWQGSDLLGQTTAVVPLEAIEPRSRVEMLQRAQALAQMYGPDAVDLPTFLQISEMPNRGMILDAVDADLARAKRENHAFRAGRGVHTAPYDDHAKHIAEHNRFRKSRAYEVMDERMRNIVDLHIQGHETRAADDAADAVGRLDVDPSGTLASAPTANEIPVPEALLQSDPVDLLGQLPPSGDTIPDVPAF